MNLCGLGGGGTLLVRPLKKIVYVFRKKDSENFKMGGGHKDRQFFFSIGRHKYSFRNF